MPNKNIIYTGCSKNLLSRVNAGGRWDVVYNAIDFSKYTLQEKVSEDAPLIFLGRIEKVKGAHTAIRVAKATGNRLILAGNISPLPDEQAYFDREIKPHIDDMKIRYVGPLNDEQKNEWLGKAKALLFPIEWNEPFGMVMVEAMACGTPVIGFDKGSVSEVVMEGITGNVVKSENDMINTIEKLQQIDRRSCRAYAMNKFDVSQIAVKYLSLFNV
jgi:glycosyltransferase involved in cell wall biosynthesis